MSGIKHTPGNWRIDDSEESIVRVVSPWSSHVTTDNFQTFADYRGAHICEMRWNSGVPSHRTAIANAKLITAAPELLEALESALPYLHKETRIKAEEAIKKATA